MTCYVDTVRAYTRAGGQEAHYCHLLADDRAELHELAARLGLPRRAFQEHPWRWHYDLPGRLRPAAISAGARSVEMHAVGALLRARRLALTRR